MVINQQTVIFWHIRANNQLLFLGLRPYEFRENYTCCPALVAYFMSLLVLLCMRSWSLRLINRKGTVDHLIQIKFLPESILCVNWKVITYLHAVDFSQQEISEIFDDLQQIQLSKSCE